VSERKVSNFRVVAAGQKAAPSRRGSRANKGGRNKVRRKQPTDSESEGERSTEDSELDKLLDQLQEAASATQSRKEKNARKEPPGKQGEHKKEPEAAELAPPEAAELAPPKPAPQPYWREKGMEVGQLVVLKGDGDDGWWVGEVQQLVAAVWDENLGDEHPDQPTHDMAVVEYSGVGANGTFKEVKSARAVPPTNVWSHSADQWGSKSDILTKAGKLKMKVQRALGQLA
jgi:hypothetical protein